MTHTLPMYLGIDYHKDTLQACLLDRDGTVRLNRGFDNNAAAVAGGLAEAGLAGQIHVAIENGCGAAHLADELAELGWAVQMAHPTYVAKLKQSPDKTDFSDARLLADLRRVGYLPGSWLPPKVVRERRTLVRHRRSIVADATSAKLRVHAVLRQERRRCDFARPWTKAWLAWVGTLELPAAMRYVLGAQLRRLEYLSAEKNAAEEALRRAFAGDPLVARLTTLPGIGEVTAWTIAAMIGRFDRFKNGRQLSRYCGLTPRNASSGRRVADAGLVAGADDDLRTVLIEMAHRLMRRPGRWGDLGRSLRGRGKPANVAAAAVANRYVRWMFHRMTEATA